MTPSSHQARRLPSGQEAKDACPEPEAGIHHAPHQPARTLEPEGVQDLVLDEGGYDAANHRFWSIRHGRIPRLERRDRPAQVAGSLNITVVEAIDVVGGAEEEDPLLHATAKTPARSRLDANATARKSRGELDFAVIECLLE